MGGNLTKSGTSAGETIDVYTLNVQNGTPHSEPWDVFGLGGNDTLYGDEGPDALIGGAGADHLDGRGGHNSVGYPDAATGVTADLLNPSLNTGEAAGDTYVSISVLTGSSLNDILRGDANDNRLLGGDGSDVLVGRAGSDDLYGYEADDILDGGLGADHMDGYIGDDTASYADASTGVIVDLMTPASNTGDASGDTYVSIENLTGSTHSDRLFGTDTANILRGGAGSDVLTARGGADQLFGDKGDDVLRGGAGIDLLAGGKGSDTASYADSAIGIRADLSKAGKNTGDAAGDTYIAVENLQGSGHDDPLSGNGKANALFGLSGDDELVGRGGKDVLFGDAGDDTLDGGKGADRLHGGTDDATDTFVFHKGGSGTGKHAMDRIYDFDRHDGNEAVHDLIDLRDLHIKLKDIDLAVHKHSVTLLLDTHGNGNADMAIQITKVDDLNPGDLLL